MMPLSSRVPPDQPDGRGPGGVIAKGFLTAKDFRAQWDASVIYLALRAAQIPIW